MTERYCSEHYYKGLRQVLSPSEREAFRNQQKNHKTFYAMMLSVEECHPELLQFVQKNYMSYQFSELLDYITGKYPDQSINLVKAHIRERMETERGRSVYRQLVQLLVKVSEIENQDNEIAMLVNELYTRYSRLPALRDELKMAGF